MIVKSENTKHRIFKKVDFEVLATGKKSMLTKMNYKAGDKVSSHSHPNEQCGYVISGEYKIRIGETTAQLEKGDSYCIPENIEHSWEVMKAGEVIDVFTPPREDYL